MTDDMRGFCRHRLLALIRINGLLRNAIRLKKANQPDRVKLFVDEAKETIEAFVESTEMSKKKKDDKPTCAGCKFLDYYNDGEPFCTRGISHACISSRFAMREATE